MPFFKRPLILAFLSLSSFNTWAEQCSPETLSKNRLNNFILLNEQYHQEVPESAKIEVESRDGYLRTSINARYSRCGELLEGSSIEVKTSTFAKTAFTATNSAEMRKEDYGWHILFDGKGVSTDNSSHKSTQLFRQTFDGMYMLNDTGIISKMLSRGTIVAAKPGEKDKTNLLTILYNVDPSNILVSSENKGSLAIDNYRTEYEYDANHRLKKIVTPRTVEEFVHDEQGREVSVTKTQTYFTVEKTVSTCQEWNAKGDCIRANMLITITPTELDKGKPYEHKYEAVMTSTYRYWN